MIKSLAWLTMGRPDRAFYISGLLHRVARVTCSRPVLRMTAGSVTCCGAIGVNATSQTLVPLVFINARFPQGRLTGHGQSPTRKLAFSASPQPEPSWTPPQANAAVRRRSLLSHQFLSDSPDTPDALPNLGTSARGKAGFGDSQSLIVGFALDVGPADDMSAAVERISSVMGHTDTPGPARRGRKNSHQRPSTRLDDEMPLYVRFPTYRWPSDYKIRDPWNQRVEACIRYDKFRLIGPAMDANREKDFSEHRLWLCKRLVRYNLMLTEFEDNRACNAIRESIASLRTRISEMDATRD